MKLAIQINNLVKSYGESGKKRAIDNLNLEVEAGSIFGLLGPNGAGKSTLINILAGVVIKSEGRVIIADYNIDDQRKAASHSIGIVPQEISLDNFFSVAQVLEITAGYYGIKPDNRKTETILHDLQLYDKRDNRPRQLSGGMRRRLLIAKALVHSPKILILDEPTAGVDVDLRDGLWQYIRKLHKQGTTVILTTHYLAEAQALCDTIAFISQGKIIKQDTKENLLNNLGSKYLEIDFYNDLTSEYLEAIEQYQGKIIDNKTIHIYYDAPPIEILTELHSAGLQIKDIKTHQTDLEDIFKQLMKQD